MFTLLVIVVWVAIAGIYLLQFQIVKDYQSEERGYYYEVITDNSTNYYPVEGIYYDCNLIRYSIFDWKRIDIT